MNKIGIGIDYSNVCKDYNTMYLDRDNTDKETIVCMTQVVEWLKALLNEMVETYNYRIYRMNQDTPVAIEDVAHRRFLFYSLEKEMLMQTFVVQGNPIAYDTLTQWAENAQDGMLIQNDAEGEGLFFYLEENSPLHHWLKEKLNHFSLEDVPFDA
ncbi:MAG TPA: hypothetical protein PLH07_05885 [Sulfurovum sp.]|jgi:hypothetical protein|nr:MAG: hypothetical protein B7Y63_03835 [Sulfurovum sp. 35-42-20]OYY57015.1 MAG: hypothetical protein B7Y52_02295 [Sulfurovum sp. 28-43-6]OYZ25511.1 MAG: hypothetical protein B7Y23_04995 [Sulfurovum sp. 16-42-52]OYZ48218.1 MAG: hypothetical protein B7Y13_08305 [Sulfurovum sp. 24-42-9]OZA45630.1 MAG: hypothetical protein B7X80_04440 [Sulfurovum sp. 17-42-90]OZA59366.1 MAG: hypothetical protein B7X69_08240 [Sulfurovum sp. 39-42-12]HQR74019.1 hypothetical protein [Sulfurovum sp.]